MDNFLLFDDLNWSYLSNKKINLSSNDNHFVGRIMHVSKSEIKIIIDKSTPVQVKSTLTCNLFYADFFAKFTTEVLRLTDGVLVLKSPKEIEKLQLRESLRVPCYIDCSVLDIAEGKILNISTGGAYIKIHEDFSSKKHVGLNVKLIFNINNKDILMDAKVLDEGSEFIRVQFKNVKDEIEDFIGDYCSRIDASLYRRDK